MRNVRKTRQERETVTHGFPPVFDSRSAVLMLGTMPSPKSREQGFYYGHPRNRFWEVLSEVLGEKKPETVEEKKAILLRRRIALWDVLAECEIRGADDGSIRNPVANDLAVILSAAPVKAVFTTGSKAGALYKQYCLPDTGIPAIALPSTSPANCRAGREELRRAYEKILDYL